MAIIYGINPVCEALESGVDGIRKMIVAKGRGGENLGSLLKLAEQRKIEVEFREREYLDRLTGRATHQGVLCFVPEFSYAGVEDVIEHRLASYRDSLVLILDSVTDPQNLGTLIRSAHCFGVNGVIIPENRAASVNPAAVKASAGATQRTLIARVVNIANAIDTLKERGFWIYGAEAEAGEDIRRVDYQGHVALVMGSEGKGLRPLVKKKCDFLISIPMGGKINSLNVSVAAGVILFDIFTKRLASAKP
jgi:23S rRNA (guanosine2251-2'-O)-methyltransferase